MRVPAAKLWLYVVTIQTAEIEDNFFQHLVEMTAFDADVLRRKAASEIAKQGYLAEFSCVRAKPISRKEWVKQYGEMLDMESEPVSVPA